MADKSERALREEKILQFWQENKIFEKSLEKDSPQGNFVFYEGPPTANGMPAIHHLEARAFKDAIPRYKTMRGFRVPRKAGWDTHGLPVELEVEKTLGLKSKKEIESYGIAKFNEECRKSVLKYIDEWKKFTSRIGYWMNLDNAYFTYDNSYMESVWSIIAYIDKRKLLYKDYKVVPWCPRCGTALSSHELAQGYKEVKDLSVYVKFKIVGQENTYLIAWTTTPWTLPGNLALAVGANIKYSYVKDTDGNTYIVASDLVSKLFGEKVPAIIVQNEVTGKDLVGLSYKPLYPFLKDKSEKSFKVYAADFVNTEDGTGIVHTAVMYGQDDFELGTKAGLPKFHLVAPDGTFIKGTDWLEGRSVVDETLAVDILKDLQKRGLLFDKENHTHSYPFCWRCKTRLIYYARDSWYIKMSQLRDKLISENEKINWEPAHIKEGRFGEWLREVKDWAISRERYWGTPLPVWQNADGSKKIVVDSLETLEKYGKKSGNKYFIMRHGEAESNAKNVLDLTGDPNNHLTDKGREEAKRVADRKFDLVFSSPFPRTRETASIITNDFAQDERLREVKPNEDKMQIRRRMGEFLFELERKYRNKNILIISHGEPLWWLEKVANGDQSEFSGREILYTGEVRELAFVPIPHNENYELDLHKPYIDEVVLEKDGEEYRRVKEVMDVWFDSGAMPFAQDPKNILYPADFISEAIDQTRGWFYTLHAIGVLMEKGIAYRNVICLGHLLDKEGRKMSKSVGNVVNPDEMVEKYGVDALRFWMYSINQPGESKNFDEATVAEINRKVFNILDNVFSFYDLYRDRKLESSESKEESKNILDKWILARLNELIAISTVKLDAYKLLEPTRAIRDFIDDLSTWYLRRSRGRIKENDKAAKQTLRFVLIELSKLMAPFTPFIAEDIYQKVRGDKDAESVHLENWPTVKKSFLWLTFLTSNSSGKDIIRDMEKTRRIVSLALEARSKANIKVRQPLNQLRIKSKELKEEFLDLIRNELNVKRVVIDKNLEQEVELDTRLTPELEEEGLVREEIRNIQEMRKEKGLHPKDAMKMAIPENKKPLYEKYKVQITSATNIELN
ncbi:MAG: class I tRNA ligase family protein [Parcubacteria group bacterium]